jgi:hypothetical protein
MSLAERGGEHGKNKLSSEELSTSGAKWVNRGIKWIPQLIPSITISFRAGGFNYEGKLSRSYLDIKKTPCFASPEAIEADIKEGEKVSTNNGEWTNPIIAYEQATAKPLDEDTEIDVITLMTGSILDINTARAKKALDKIAGEFFDVLDSNPTKPSTTN